MKTCSSSVLERVTMPSCSSTGAKTAESGTNTFPVAGRTTISGDTSDRLSLTILLKPLKTERIMTSAAVPIAIPATPIPEIRFITLYDFRAKRYRRAILSGSFVIF